MVRNSCYTIEWYVYRIWKLPVNVPTSLSEAGPSLKMYLAVWHINRCIIFYCERLSCCVNNIVSHYLWILIHYCLFIGGCWWWGGVYRFELSCEPLFTGRQFKHCIRLFMIIIIIRCRSMLVNARRSSLLFYSITAGHSPSRWQADGSLAKNAVQHLLPTQCPFQHHK